MALVRSATGQLVEQESLQDRVQRIAGSGSLPPTSPYAAAATGASPDQTKMAGTPAQKKPVMQEQVAKEQTLAGAQRLDQATGVQATTEQQQAQQRAQQLKAVGSLSARMQSLVEQRLAQGTAQVGQMIVDQEALKLATGLDDTDPMYTQVLDKVTAFSQNPSEENLVAIQQLVDADGDPLLDIETVAEMTDQFLTADETVAQQFSAAVLEQGQQLTLGDLEPQDLGYANWGELAEAAGIDATEIEGLTVKDLQTRVEDLQDRQFSRVQSLQARIAATPPGSARRRILERQLQEIQQAGVLGAEAMVAETVEDIDLADEVEIGGESYDIEELFEEETLSELITSYLSAPDSQKDEILPPEIFGDLTGWIDRNSLALADLADTVAETEETWEKAQDDWSLAAQVTEDATLHPDVMETLFGWDADKVVTSTEMADLAKLIEESSIGKLAADEEYEQRDALLRALTGDNLDDVMVDGELLPAAQLKAAYEAGQELLDPNVAALAGMEATDFVTDPTAQATVETAMQVDDALDVLPDDLDITKAEIMESDSFLALSAANKLAIAENPERFANFMKYDSMSKEVAKIDSYDEAIKYMFGDTMTPETLTSVYDQVYAQANAGFKDAKRALKLFKKAFGGNGKPSEASMTHIMNKLNGELGKTNLDNIATGAGVDFGQFNKLLSSNLQSFSAFSNTNATLPVNGRGMTGPEFYDTVSKYAADGNVSGSDFTSIVSSLADKVIYNKDGSPSQSGYGGYNINAVAAIYDNLNYSQANKGSGFPKSWSEAKTMVMNGILNKESGDILKKHGIDLATIDRMYKNKDEHGRIGRSVVNKKVYAAIKKLKDAPGIPSTVKAYYDSLIWKMYVIRGKRGI